MSAAKQSRALAAALASAAAGGTQLVVAGRGFGADLGTELVSWLFVVVATALVGLALGGALRALLGWLKGGAVHWVPAGLGAVAALWVFTLLDPGRVASVGALRAAVVGLLAGTAVAFVLDRLAFDSSESPLLGRALPWCAALGLTLVLHVLTSTSPRRAPEVGVDAPRTAPCVLLITLDTLRADRLPALGHALGSTPVLDGLAEQGAVFRSVASQSHLTGPSHLTILTGMRPDSHGVYDNAVKLPAGLETIAGLAASRGMETAAFLGAWPVSAEALGVTTRFQWADEDLRQLRTFSEAAYDTGVGWIASRVVQKLGFDQRRSERPAGDVNAAAMRWLDRPSDRPFFVWTHYYDPHLPYAPPAEYRPAVDDAPDWYDDAVVDQDVVRRELDETARREAARTLGRLYDAEISYSDAELGRLVAKARERAGERPLWVFVTSDHGESFGEHGNYYWRDVYQPTMHVPLFIVPPNGAARRVVVDEVVGLIDVAPTIAEVIGARWSEAVDGRSLLPLLDEAGWDAAPRSSIFVDRVQRRRRDRRQEAVRDGRYKLVRKWAGWGRTDERWLDEEIELFDLEADPGELDNLAESLPEVASRLLALLPEPLDAQLGRADELTPEQQQRLRALGYL